MIDNYILIDTIVDGIQMIIIVLIISFLIQKLIKIVH